MANLVKLGLRIATYSRHRAINFSVISRNLCDQPPVKMPLHTDANYVPSKLNKKILVWTGRYKSEEEIPRRVSYTTLANARDKFRVMAAFCIMVTTSGMMLLVIFNGQRIRRQKILEAERLVEEEG